MTPVWFTAAYVGGVVCGVLLREAVELFRGEDEMSTLGLWFRIHRITIEMMAVVVSMIFCSVVGLTLIADNNSREDLLECVTAYNEQSGKARDERNIAVDEAAAAELGYVRADLSYQRGLVDALENKRGVASLTGTIRMRIAANEAYLKTLTSQQKVRARSAYPPPDYCQAHR